MAVRAVAAGGRSGERAEVAVDTWSISARHSRWCDFLMVSITIMMSTMTANAPASSEIETIVAVGSLSWKRKCSMDAVATSEQSTATTNATSAMRRGRRSRSCRRHALSAPWCSSRITKTYSRLDSSSTSVPRPSVTEAELTNKLSVHRSPPSSTSMRAVSEKPASSAAIMPMDACDETLAETTSMARNAEAVPPGEPPPSLSSSKRLAWDIRSIACATVHTPARGEARGDMSCSMLAFVGEPVEAAARRATHLRLGGGRSAAKRRRLQAWIFLASFCLPALGAMKKTPCGSSSQGAQADRAGSPTAR